MKGGRCSMKKKLLFVLAACTLVLTACGPNDNESNDDRDRNYYASTTVNDNDNL